MATEMTETEETTSTDAAEQPVNGSASTQPLGQQGLTHSAIIRACPLPSGAVIFGDMTSAFVDGPRLLRFLGDQRHTGVLVGAGRGNVEAVLLYEGSVIGLLGTGDGTTRRLEKIALPGPGAGEEHDITVMTYRPEVALALAQLINETERFERMSGSFVDLGGLLGFLRRENASGGVRITTSDDVGVILLRGGEALGAYTRQKPELDDVEVVFPLARSADAEIDVHVGAVSLPPSGVRVDAVIS